MAFDKSAIGSLEVPHGQPGGQPPPYQATTSTSPYSHGGLYGAADPRSSSAQSLVPSLPEYEEFAKRKLLIIYIHGFMGNDSSFQSFPLHVHRYLKEALAETHVIHSKIYPRYKTYKAIEVARDNFSTWLQPHESPTTDVVLVGHSMGGLLAAEVILMNAARDQQNYFKHRILGAIHLDSPILGLHPGIVVSGISSLFRPKPEKPGQQPGFGDSTDGLHSPNDVLSPTQSVNSQFSFETQSTETSSAPSSIGFPNARTMDPTFDPSFPNDIRLKDRTWWKNIVHFAKKHNSEGLIDAATKHIMSHLEFGSCLMDFGGLKQRYENVRKLEDMDDVKNYGFPHVPPQVRFVQYYTVCYGFPKTPKTPKEEERPLTATQSLDAVVATRPSSSEGSTPRVSTEEKSEQNNALNPLGMHPVPKTAGSPGQRSASASDWSGSELEFLDPEPMSDEEVVATDASTSKSDEKAITRKPVAGSDSGTDEKPALQPEEPSTSTEAVEPSEKGIEKDANNDKEHSSQNPPRIVKESATGTITDLTQTTSTMTLDLPAIPEPPTPPTLPDLASFSDKDARKQAEKESKRLLKAYEQAVKDRNKAIKERDKIIEKRQKKMVQEAEKRAKEEEKKVKLAEKQKQKEEEEAARQKRREEEEATKRKQKEEEEAGKQKQKEDEEAAKKEAEAKAVADAANVSQSAAAAAPSSATEYRPDQLTTMPSSSSASTPQSPPHSTSEARSPSKPEKEKKKKERKFINLPSKVNGQVDPKWVKIFMKDMDETAAHTSLFFPGEHYERLVTEVGDAVLGWVQYDMTKKAITGMQ